MNKTFAEGVELAREVNEYVRYKEGSEGVSIILGTPFIHHGLSGAQNRRYGAAALISML